MPRIACGIADTSFRTRTNMGPGGRMEQADSPAQAIDRGTGPPRVAPHGGADSTSLLPESPPEARRFPTSTTALRSPWSGWLSPKAPPEMRQPPILAA